MPAPKGNNNAEKWTYSTTMDKLHQLQKYAMLEHITTLHTALSRVDLYDGVWTYWRQRWSGREDIMHRMCVIDQIFTSKIIEGALHKRLHAGMAMFILRAKHGMRDKPLKKSEREAEVKLEPHLQASLDRIEAEKKAEASAPPITKEEPQTAAPAKPAILPHHRPVGKLTYAPQAKLTSPILQRPKDHHPDPDARLNKPIEQKAAA